MISKKTGIILLLTIALLMLVIGLLMPATPQPQSYYQFADQRSYFSIPNALNVLSNISFALAGIWGLYLLFSPGTIQFIDNRERWLWMAISLGLILVGWGSCYFHLAPSNSRLVWDRLPMTIVFMSFVAVLVSDRISSQLGFYLWPFLLGIGIYSVLQWQASELNGTGNVLLYAAVQGYTAIVAVVMLMMPSRYTKSRELVIVILFYVLAKVFEMYDTKISMLSAGIISGHTLKHLAAAMAGVWIIRIMWKRKIVMD